MSGKQPIPSTAGCQPGTVTLSGQSELVVVHSSDLHIGVIQNGRDVNLLDRVISTAHGVGAHVLLLVGDVFDNNSLPQALIDSVGRSMAEAGLPIVILPGNHDCLIDNSAYHRGGFANIAGVHIIGISVEDSVLFPDLGLEVWGRPHLSYSDFPPLCNPRPRNTPWQIVMAHGHWVTEPDDLQRSWLIRDEDIAATEAHYVALGHWEAPRCVGDGSIPAYYSGSPIVAQTLNVISLADGAARVSHVPLHQKEI